MRPSCRGGGSATIRPHENPRRLARALRAPASQDHRHSGLDRVRAVAERLDLRFDCPVITVAGTNGKGSTCAMLESIAAACRLPHRRLHLAAPRALRGALPPRAARSVQADALVPHFEAVEAARGDVVARPTSSSPRWRSCACMAAATPGRRDPRSRPGRPARRGQHHRRRLRRHHQHRPRPHGFPRAGPREHRPREGRHPARRQARPSCSDPMPPQA